MSLKQFANLQTLLFDSFRTSISQRNAVQKAALYWNTLTILDPFLHRHCLVTCFENFHIGQTSALRERPNWAFSDVFWRSPIWRHTRRYKLMQLTNRRLIFTEHAESLSTKLRISLLPSPSDCADECHPTAADVEDYDYVDSWEVSLKITTLSQWNTCQSHISI